VEVTDVTDGSINGETIPIFMWDFVDANTVQVLVMMPIGVGVSGSGHLAEVGFKVKGKEGDKSILDISNGKLCDIRTNAFSIDKGFKDDLNDEEISDKLKEIFKGNGSLLENPTVSVIQKDEKWKIIDKRVYVVTFKYFDLKVLDTGEILETKWVDAEIRVGEEEEEEEEEEVTPGYSNITTWNPIEVVVNNAAGESRAFNITVNQIADISWQINGTEVQINESTREAVFTNTSAVIGTWNVSAIATNTTTELSDMHTWIWSVTLTAPVTPTPTLAPGETPTPTLAPGETPKPATPTPTLAPGETPKPATPTPTPTPKPAIPGFEVIFVIAAMTLFLFTKHFLSFPKKEPVLRKKIKRR
jgi:cell division septation protein DedD